MSSPETPPNPKEKFSKKLTEMGGLGKKMADKAAPAMKIMAAVSKKALAIKDLSVGEMLVEYGILTKAKYAQVMESVTERHSFSQMVVEKGFAKEKDVLSAINKYYRLKLTKIDESTAHAIQNRPRTFLEKAITARLPIKVKLSLAIVATMVVSIFILSYTILQHQKTQLYKETVKTGRVSLTYFTSNARVHLLNDNILQLNVLINEAKSTEGLLFATIVDRNGIIKADTNTKLIGKKYKKPANAEGLVEEENSSYFTFTNSDGREVLNLSAPVT
ncbi:MAG: hypothetical protein OEW12_01345, partial [Deltaproteobacteria bacterium]|nr:hypothetical protein [Deltaproteobacteria bacterium]